MRKISFFARKLKFDFWCGLRFLARGEHLLCRKAVHVRDEILRKFSDENIVALNGVVVIGARDGDAIFRSFELILQREKIFVRLEIGIVFRHRQKISDARAQLILRVLEFLKFLRVLQIACVDINVLRFRAHFDNFDKSLAFVRGVAFDRAHQIGNQIRAALILSLDLRPFRIDIFVQLDHRIVVANEKSVRGKNHDQNHAERNQQILQTFFHFYFLRIFFRALK